LSYGNKLQAGVPYIGAVDQSCYTGYNFFINLLYRSNVEKRVELNAVTFQTNYLIVLVTVFLLGLFSSPFLLFVVLLCVALWCELV
jgi:hypothetical protein